MSQRSSVGVANLNTETPEPCVLPENELEMIWWLAYSRIIMPLPHISTVQSWIVPVPPLR